MLDLRCSKLVTILLLSYSISGYSQLAGSDAELWEKANPASREATRCRDENLLNFHCGIKDKLLKKYIKYSKNRSHTLSLVHASKEDEMIWENTDKNVSLGNTVYNKGEEAKKLERSPASLLLPEQQIRKKKRQTA